LRRQSALERVAEGIDELARGNLVHRVVTPGSGETADLATAVNRLAEACGPNRRLAEKRRTQLISNLSHDPHADHLDRLLRRRPFSADRRGPERHLDIIAMKTAELARPPTICYLRSRRRGSQPVAASVDVSEVARQCLSASSTSCAQRSTSSWRSRRDVHGHSRRGGPRAGHRQFVANSLKHARLMHSGSQRPRRRRVRSPCGTTEGFPRWPSCRARDVGGPVAGGSRLSIAHELTARRGLPRASSAEVGLGDRAVSLARRPHWVRIAYEIRMVYVHTTSALLGSIDTGSCVGRVPARGWSA
jgi:hypothetical protein